MAAFRPRRGTCSAAARPVERPKTPHPWRGETMPQIFHRSFNTISLVSIYGSVFLLGGVGWAMATWVRSPYATNVGVAQNQPIPFSHQHHASELGIDCRYCHTSVEDSAFAG